MYITNENSSGTPVAHKCMWGSLNCPMIQIGIHPGNFSARIKLIDSEKHKRTKARKTAHDRNEEHVTLKHA